MTHAYTPAVGLARLACSDEHGRLAEIIVRAGDRGAVGVVGLEAGCGREGRGHCVSDKEELIK